MDRRDFLKTSTILPIIPQLNYISQNDEKSQVIYKWFCSYEGRLHSVIADDMKYTIFYVENEWIYPKVGRLFGFSDLKLAKKSHAGAILYQCLAKDVTPQEYLCRSYNDQHIEEFWKKENGYYISDIIYNMKCPEGTISCSAVKLIERIFHIY